MASSNYSAWSVVAGEQPTTAKWNILGTNDAAFNTGQGFNDAILANRHIGTSFMSAGISSFVNTGTAGGTFYYTNFGGMKMLWGISNNVSTSTSNPNYTFVWPSGFFGLIQSINVTSGPVASDSRIEPSISGYNLTSLGVFTNQLGGSTGATYIHVFIVGS